mmetsp:Transcript_29596/g.71526  ORF Transcript_29596/g.71526 Transcript_29596/m.71526 type:complete len:204 (+) Transcript_29596:697-1308(+)
MPLIAHGFGGMAGGCRGDAAGGVGDSRRPLLPALLLALPTLDVRSEGHLILLYPGSEKGNGRVGARGGGGDGRRYAHHGELAYGRGIARGRSDYRVGAMTFFDDLRRAAASVVLLDGACRRCERGQRLIGADRGHMAATSWSDIVVLLLCSRKLLPARGDERFPTTSPHTVAGERRRPGMLLLQTLPRRTVLVGDESSSATLL